MKILFSVLIFALSLLTTGAYAQDAAKGERLFTRCTACHTIEPGGSNRVGPNLYGVFGRKIASKEGFNYSPALKGIDGVWDEESLNQFILSPRTFARGTKMAYAGLRRDQERADMIAWLKANSDDTPEDTLDTSATPDPDLVLLPDAAGKMETFEACASCHSIKLVVQQGMSREDWASTLDWMVEEQGMDELDNDLSDIILDYLAENFGQDRPNYPQ